jgi:hypothetical protein
MRLALTGEQVSDGDVDDQAQACSDCLSQLPVPAGGDWMVAVNCARPGRAPGRGQRSHVRMPEEYSL